jgi:hypothetical protein
MNHISYAERLRNASLEELKTILVDDLRCPINWNNEFVGVAEQIFLRKWFYTAADNLPYGEQDVSLLTEYSDQYLPEPSELSFTLNGLSRDDACALAFNTHRERETYRKMYLASCQKYTGLNAQSKHDRDKHYPAAGATIRDIVELSKQNSEIGYLLPNLHPDAQRDFFWIAFNDAFERHVSGLKESELDDREIFDQTWNEFFGSDQFRFCVNTLTTVGYYGGKPAEWLIFDTSFHGKVTHCYPSLEAIPNAKQVALDDLQGLEEAYIEGRKDWP